jgi:hypothetical protein
MTRWQLLRAVVNWVNLMTPLGLLIARAGSATRHPGPHGLIIFCGYRLRFPDAGAFTVGNVVCTRHDAGYLLAPDRAALLGHEARHAVQAAVLGPLLGPLYLLSAGWSWLVSADLGGRNAFEVWAGLEAGGYTRRPLRPGLDRLLRALSPWRP